MFPRRHPTLRRDGRAWSFASVDGRARLSGMPRWPCTSSAARDGVSECFGRPASHCLSLRRSTPLPLRRAHRKSAGPSVLSKAVSLELPTNGNPGTARSPRGKQDGRDHHHHGGRRRGRRWRRPRLHHPRNADCQGSTNSRPGRGSERSGFSLSHPLGTSQAFASSFDRGGFQMVASHSPTLCRFVGSQMGFRLCRSRCFCGEVAAWAPRGFACPSVTPTHHFPAEKKERRRPVAVRTGTSIWANPRTGPVLVLAQ